MGPAELDVLLDEVVSLSQEAEVYDSFMRRAAKASTHRHCCWCALIVVCGVSQNAEHARANSPLKVSCNRELCELLRLCGCVVTWSRACVHVCLYVCIFV